VTKSSSRLPCSVFQIAVIRVPDCFTEEAWSAGLMTVVLWEDYGLYHSVGS
jgi:hypothetical protein